MEAEEWDISVCGLNCVKCKKYISNECRKCRGRLEAQPSPKCEILTCATEKGHQYCFECIEFPCRKVDDYSSDWLCASQTNCRKYEKNEGDWIRKLDCKARKMYVLPWLGILAIKLGDYKISCSMKEFTTKLSLVRELPF